MRTLILTLLFVATMALTSACSLFGDSIRYGGDNVDAPLADGSGAYLVCGEECAAQGQCGALASNDMAVVLINPETPATVEHGGFIQANQAVTLLASQVQPMIVPATNVRSDMLFYRVRHVRADGTQTEGWTHGMCVATRALN